MGFRFAHVALCCQEPQKVEDFYVEQLGFRRVRAIPAKDGSVVFLRLGDVCLELFQATEPRPLRPPTQAGYLFPGLRHLAFQVDDVDAALAAMGSAARVTLGPLSFDDAIAGWRAVWVADPEDNIVELSQGYRDEEPE